MVSIFQYFISIFQFFSSSLYPFSCGKHHKTPVVFAWLAKCVHPCLPSHSFPKSVGFSFCIWCFSEASIPFHPSFGKSLHCLQNGLVAEGWITRCLDLKMQTPVHLIRVILSSHCSFFPLTVNFKAGIQGIATQKAASRLSGMCMAEVTLILQKYF